MLLLLLVPFLAAFMGMLISYLNHAHVSKQSSGNERMQEIQKYIREGAWTFMFKEAKVFGIISFCIAALLWILFYWEVAFAFLLGASLSMAAGFIGMNTATIANAKVTNAAQKDELKAFKIAISGGSVMGLAVACLALIGLVILIFVFSHEFNPEVLYIESKPVPFLSDILGRNVNFIKAALIVSAYSMGASFVALIDRVGGGIYTKAADMAADLVGKAEKHLPEDDPRNPATIADNVGDNVGDVGGLGADLLESFVGAIISVLVISLYMYVGRGNADISGLFSKIGVSDASSAYWNLLMFPLLICASGIVATIIAVLYMRLPIKKADPEKLLMHGLWISAILTLAFVYIINLYMPMNQNLFISVIIGAVTGLIIGYVAEYYTSNKFAPVKKLADEVASGTGIGITAGMALGKMSTLIPGIVVAGAIIVTYQLAGLLGVAYGALGMLSFVAMNVSIDTYGPIADNAGGIAQGAELPPKVRKITDKLDAIGNTTAAVGKGFAIGSAAFAALALIAAYLWSAIGSAQEVVIPEVSILSSKINIGASVIAALFIGAMVPYVFSAVLIQAVSDTANKLVEEIKRQFKEKPGILEGKEIADYKKCIAITSESALKKLLLPALIALVMPFVIGFVLGRYALAGFLIGGLLSCMQLAVYCANTGGALDNAKKYIEEGHHGGKGSEAHVSSVIGDTVGDPLKDTVGPSLDILLKLMSVVSILFASLFPLYPIFF